jgi:hypothetical protein
LAKGELPRASVGPAHVERLELLREILKCAIELESPCDFAGAPGGRELNEGIFFGHFGEWRGLLSEWDELQVSTRLAPERLWARIEHGCAQWRLTEPPVALGTVIDRFAILTLARARAWQLETPCELSLQPARDRIRGADQVSLYMERERVASIAGPLPEGERRLEGIAQVLQGLFDEVQHAPEAHAVSATRDRLLDLKHELLSRVGALLPEAAEPVPGCPLCAILAAEETGSEDLAAEETGSPGPV